MNVFKGGGGIICTEVSKKQSVRIVSIIDPMATTSILEYKLYFKENKEEQLNKIF